MLAFSANVCFYRYAVAFRDKT